jgi:protein-S-isoprenylcysteine O-methyltransferase Ste14
VADEPFRNLVIAGFLTVLPVQLYFRIRSQATRERLDRRKEGGFILLTLRPVALVAVIGFISYMVSPESMAWSQAPLPAAVRWAGVATGLAGILWLFWTLPSLGRNLTDTVVTRQAATLVTHGPYRFVRHPFYGSMATFLLSAAVVAANWFIAAAVVVVFVLLVVRTDREEALLVARFGDAYREYAKRTGRFFPKVRPGPE